MLIKILSAQEIIRMDTLQYNDVTGIVSMAPTDGNDIIILGGHSTGYSNPDNSSGRAFLIKTASDNALSFLDSTIGGVGGIVGPAIYKEHIYIAMWLNSLNKNIPKLGGTAVDAGIYLVKYNTSGKLIWYKKQDFQAIPGGISVDGEGFVYVGYEGMIGFRKYSPEGEVLQNQFPLPGSTFDHSGNFYSNFGSWLYKFDPAGKELLKLFLGSASFSPDDEGNIYTIEYIPQLNGSLLKKLAPDGHEIWKTKIPLICTVPPSVQQQNIYIGGLYSPNTKGDWFGIYKVDHLTGDIIWQNKLSSSDPSIEVISFTSNKGYVFLASKPWDPGFSITRLVRIKDLHYIPVTTSLKSDQKKSASLKVVPNPSSGGATLYLPEQMHGYIQVQVIDAAGRVVLQQQVQNELHQNEVIIETKGLSAGIYNIQVFSEDHISTASKLVVEK